jgi:osmotically-inducible protein OsmY
MNFMDNQSSPFWSQARAEPGRQTRSQDQPSVPSDVVIEEEIWHSIFKDSSLGARYKDHLDLEVENGHVRLTGHVMKPWHGQQLIDLAKRARGVVWVESDLVADPHLQDQVIQALVQDEITSPYIFTVKSSYGWISLGGLVPTQEIVKAAEAVAGFVPAVRGILSLPSVLGATWLSADHPEPARRALQPRLAARVHQEVEESESAKEAGWVSQVVVDPCSRLVSAIVVSAGGRGGIERFIPIQDIEAVRKDQVWLKPGKAAAQFPRFERGRFPFAPRSWRPPFPYAPGTVRWSL